MGVSRRDALRMLATSLGTAGVWPYLSDSAVEAFRGLQASNAPPRLAFLTPDQYLTVEAVSETIIPADDHSPGARQARVADYIDLLLSESDEQTRKRWTSGLKALDQESRRRFDKPFAALPAPQAERLLVEISRNELNPRTRLEQFFKLTKDATIRGYYTSEIGIHQELQYKGNQYLEEFVGCTHPEHGYGKATGD
jgi:Gluconate 2-dehydrogenase subunit 3